MHYPLDSLIISASEESDLPLDFLPIIRAQRRKKKGKKFQKEINLLLHSYVPCFLFSVLQAGQIFFIDLATMTVTVVITCPESIHKIDTYYGTEGLYILVSYCFIACNC